VRDARQGAAGERAGGHGEAPPGPRGMRARGGAREEEEEEGEEKRERGRGKGELTSGSKSGDHRLQNLGHHGERERWRRGGCCARKSNERKGGGAHGGGAGRRGRAGQSRPAGPGWVGLGRVAGKKPTTRTTTDRYPIHEMRLSNTRD
jgi:hypothetical protein